MKRRARIQFWWPFLPEPTCTPFPPTLLDWLSGSLLNWVVIQLKSSASALLAGGETDHSVHAWIYYFCCCYYPWQGYGIWDPRPVASLASVLSLSPPHNKVGLNVSLEGFRSDKMLPFFFFFLQRIIRCLSLDFQDVGLIWWNIHKIETGWNVFFMIRGICQRNKRRSFTFFYPPRVVHPPTPNAVGGCTTLRSLGRAEPRPLRHSCDHLHSALWI